MRDYKTNKELLEELNEYVKGHLEAKKALIALVNRSRTRYHQRFKHLHPEEDWISSTNALLIGPSGTGKTALVRALSKVVDFPLLCFDATNLRPGGGSDGLNAHGIRKLIKKNAEELVANKPLKYRSVEGAIDQTVVFIDEICKLSYGYESSGNWNSHIQASLLTLLDDPDGLYGGVSYILAGAFSRLDRGDKDSKRSSIGFHGGDDKGDELPPIDERLISGGMIPELIGRINSIVELDTLEKENYEDIMDNMLIPKKIEELLYFNRTTLNMPNEVKDEIIEKAIKSGQGVRYMKRELDKWALELEFSYEDVTEESLLLECLATRFENQAIGE